MTDDTKPAPRTLYDQDYVDALVARLAEVEEECDRLKSQHDALRHQMSRAIADARQARVAVARITAEHKYAGYAAEDIAAAMLHMEDETDEAFN